MNIGQCRLCGNNNITLKNSHIIPEFAYSPVYDAKHRFIDFSEDSKTGARFEQKGTREYLLCGDCELLLSQYENNLSDFVINFAVSRNNIFPLVGRYLINTNIKYNSVKTAILSIIYRLSVSKLPQYDGYQLGPYESILKDVILNNKHIDTDTFSTHISPITYKGNYYPGLIMTYEKPSKYKNQYTILCFVMYGLLFDVMISKMDKNDIWHIFSLKEDGTIIFQDIEIPDINIKTDLIKRYQDDDVKKLLEKQKTTP